MKKIDKHMTIGEILEIDNSIAEILMEIGMRCLGCPSASAETLEQACNVHGVNVNDIVDKINNRK